MDQLKVQVGKMHELDRHCVLLLDEISLSSGLHYEPHKGHISGYEDLGHLGRSEKVADHALVFLVRGIRKNWKQAIAYYFTSKTVSTLCLKKLDSRMKMKVKVAAAQLSYSVAACIETWVASGNLPSEAVHTAEFVHKVDSLFDSLNGYSFSVPEGLVFSELKKDMKI
ncbi:hypothetical protein HHI36_003756 [Cryptolaemus montrouzieri]|uniref:Uncharacterized protein n=1 Tax=Cryptolaemus montrouzieri TaxID=559131 RepID=A0ABD2PFB7_9CUCU